MSHQQDDEEHQPTYEKKEPAVIDDEMMSKAVYEQGPQEYAAKIAKEEGISFFDVTKLRLDYRNILRIDNLWCFTSLVHLQLDNNLIEKIENLDHLVNLVWLDLSFNNIEKIEGLSELANLEDLILYNNRIERIHNLNSQTKLQVLSIGNNAIKDFDTLIYLRRFKKLQTLNLAGNPISQHDDYSPYVSALLKDLIYFDHFLVDPQMRARGLEKFDIALQKLDDEDAAVDLLARLEAENQGQFEYNMAAYVENMDKGKFFDLLYAEEADVIKLDLVQEVAAVRQSYREKFVEVCQAVFKYGIERHEERLQEIQQFKQCSHEAIMASREAGSAKIDEFLKYKDQLWSELFVSTDSKLIGESMAEYYKKLTEMKDTLTGCELLLVDQLEELVRDFDRNMREQLSIFLEFLHGQMAICRDLENMNHERMLEMCIVVMEKLVHNELTEEVESELSEILTDKENVISIVTASHDLHLLRLDNREDASVKRSNEWINSTVEDLHENMEMHRNRERIVEINHFIEYHQELGVELADYLYSHLEVPPPAEGEQTPITPGQQGSVHEEISLVVETPWDVENQVSVSPNEENQVSSSENQVSVSPDEEEQS